MQWVKKSGKGKFLRVLDLEQYETFHESDFLIFIRFYLFRFVSDLVESGQARLFSRKTSERFYVSFSGGVSRNQTSNTGRRNELRPLLRGKKKTTRKKRSYSFMEMRGASALGVESTKTFFLWDGIFWLRIIGATGKIPERFRKPR